MRHAVNLTEQIRGRYEHVPAILRLDCERIVHEPLRELRVPVGRSTVGRRVDARIGHMRLVGRASGLSPSVVEIPVQWRAAEHARLFPAMTGVLRVTRAGPDAIEVRLVGSYAPPLGPLGELGDRIAGHDAAVASSRGVLAEVARRLEDALRNHAPPPRPWARPQPERSP